MKDAPKRRYVPTLGGLLAGIAAAIAALSLFLSNPFGGPASLEPFSQTVEPSPAIAGSVARR